MESVMRPANRYEKRRATMAFGLWASLRGPAAWKLLLIFVLACAVMAAYRPIRKLVVGWETLGMFGLMVSYRQPKSVPAVPGHILVPGAGWGGVTVQPPAVGDAGAAGYDAKAIARWDVVPHQTFADEFNVGVVAFHMNGIEKVSFSVNGGGWRDVATMTANPQTAGNGWSSVEEYWVTLDAALFDSEEIEVRAIAYPVTGVPRVLEGLKLFANPDNAVTGAAKYVSPSGNDTTGDGSAGNPYATIYKAMLEAQSANGGKSDHNRIYLMAGNHTWTGRTSYGATPILCDHAWLAVEAAPGVAKEDVVLNADTSAYSPEFTLVKFSGVTLSTWLGPRSTRPAAIWMDGCELRLTGTTNPTVIADYTLWTNGIYLTNSTHHTSRRGIGWTRLVRNVNLYNIGEIGFWHPQCLINVDVSDITLAEAGYHTDVIYYRSDGSNTIVYNFTSANNLAQGLFYRVHYDAPIAQDMAFVNVVMVTTANMYSQFMHPVNHLVMKNVWFDGRQLIMQQDPNRALPMGVTNAYADNVWWRLNPTDEWIATGWNGTVVP